MQDMEKRMNEMQNHYQQQIDEMRASHEAYKERNQRALSAGSNRRVNSYKDFKDDSDINERDKDILIGSYKADLQNSSRESLKRNELLKRDQSAQVIESQRQQNSILK